VIHYARAAETEFVGLQCGIMDQCISVMAQKDHALFLDCKTVEFQQVPFPSGNRIVICDTGVRRELTRTAYNRREAECEEAVRQIKKTFPDVASLRDVSYAEFQSIEGSLPAITARRARHVITENDRVIACVKAMHDNNLEKIGRLMTESHMSLRDDFDVSCHELDAFVDIAVGVQGVYGARMTGAGFGGCAICLVSEAQIDNLVEKIRMEYPKQGGRSFTIYLTTPANGTVLYPPEQLQTSISVTHT